MHLPCDDGFSSPGQLCGGFCEPAPLQMQWQDCERFCGSFALGDLRSQLWVLRFYVSCELEPWVPSGWVERGFDPASSQVWKRWVNGTGHEVLNHLVGRISFAHRVAHGFR